MPRSRTDQLLLVAGVLCLLAAPWSWIDDGVTPSWVVFPVFVAVGLWRLTTGRGRLWLAISATVFVLVHLPWTWAALTGGDNPIDAAREVNAGQWLVTLLVLPLLTAVLGWVAWSRRRNEGDATAA